ncbi:hypothetical protein DBR32_10770 [Taibaiella sp. KBW10]|uniref:hypothetical protein n=1 Tax=Taibaiella sp. KBW10 TaxID=2153357 RepID=UPI000F59C478|nr:hypothetical protein [Taibaiella sp. KBW10]RQO30065.1 hypothetical protein DBR32_10770 [Taibaiella sp. KBW10]
MPATFVRNQAKRIMSVSFINFNSFGQEELCHFIAQRCYEHMHQSLSHLQVHYLHENCLHESGTSDAALPFLFLQFKDECEQLILLEEQLILPYFNKTIYAQKRYRENTALNPKLLSRKHRELQERYTNMKNDTLQKIRFKEDTQYQILRYDLQVTATQLKDWHDLINILFQKDTLKETL